jgi:hypothetical protein
MGSRAEGRSSVAPKLLHDIQSQSLAGMRLVQNLQVGCLMGCLTHLSLAGEPPFKMVTLGGAPSTDVAFIDRRINSLHNMMRLQVTWA